MEELTIKEVVEELEKPPGESRYSSDFLEACLTVLSWFDGSRTGGKAFEYLNKLEKDGKQ